MSNKAKKSNELSRPVISAQFIDDFKKQFDRLPNKDGMKLRAQLRGTKKRRK